MCRHCSGEPWGRGDCRRSGIEPWTLNMEISRARRPLRFACQTPRRPERTHSLSFRCCAFREPILHIHVEVCPCGLHAVPVRDIIGAGVDMVRPLYECCTIPRRRDCCFRVFCLLSLLKALDRNAWCQWLHISSAPVLELYEYSSITRVNAKEQHRAVPARLLCTLTMWACVIAALFVPYSISYPQPYQGSS